MFSLSKIHLKSNPKVILTHDGGHLSSDSGLTLIADFVKAIGLRQMLTNTVHFNDHRAYYAHFNADLILQIIYQKIAGYATDEAANKLANDPTFKLILASGPATQPTISRCWARCTPTTNEGLRAINWRLADIERQRTNKQTAVIDLDSTHFDTFGHQEATSFNGHYQTIGYHPLVMFDGITGTFLDAQLRPGNVYTSNGVRDFVLPTLGHYQKSAPVTDVLVRGDSGFATPSLYEVCEQQAAKYVIRLKDNPVLERRAEALDPGSDRDWGSDEVRYFSIPYQAKGWSKSRRVCIEAKRSADSFFFQHTFIVTNLKTFSPKEVFRTYRKRGTMENYIKEAKSGFYCDKTDSSQFVRNEARMFVGMLAYNVVNLMRELCFNSKAQAFRIETIRNLFIKVAGRVVKTGRQIYLKLSSHQVYQSWFDKILIRIQQLGDS